MKYVFKLVIFSAMALIAADGMALDKAKAREIFNSNGCASCHQPAEKLVGPSLKDIAKRYKGKKVSRELATVIREGSEGKWGDLPHPAIATLEPEEAELLANWILAGSP